MLKGCMWIWTKTILKSNIKKSVLHPCSLVLFLFNVLTHYTYIWNNNIQHNSSEIQQIKKRWKHKGAYKMISPNFLILDIASWQLVLMDMVHSSTTVTLCKQWQIRFIMHEYKMKWKCYGRKQNKAALRCSHHKFSIDWSLWNIQIVFIKFCL